MSYPSSRKEPVSMKLRVANMKQEDVQGRTKQLEEESRKMEDRLRELKLAMNREKELREQRGGGHWKSGKEGNLNTHAKDVLNKPPSKPKPSGSGKVRKVKVLKEEPIKTKTKEKPQPGTLAYIAQRDSSKPGLRPDGPICGQCEIKAAVVTCQECSELYCSGCFTAFHLKGALAKHRSVPVSKIAATPRGFNSSNQSSMSMPPSNLSAGSSNRPSTAEMRIKWEQHDPAPTKRKTVIEYANEESNQGGSLLDGTYDEREAANEFQQALREWRKENTDPEPPISSSRGIKPTQLSARNGGRNETLGTKKPKVKIVSPVTTPRVNIDEGTSTNSGSIKPTTAYEPEFTQKSEISYAERLMIKKNRRSEVPSSVNSGSSSYGAAYRDGTGEDDLDDAPAVPSFDSLLATVQAGARGGQIDENDDYMNSRAGTVVEIEELFIDEYDDSIDDESHYVVSEGPEVSEPTDAKQTLPTVLPAPTAMFQKCSKPRTPRAVNSSMLPGQHQSGSMSRVSSSLQVVDVSDSMDTITDVTPTPTDVTPTLDNSQISLSKGTKPKSARKHPAPSNSRPGSASSVSSGKRPPKSARGAKNSPPTKSNNKADSVMSRPPSRGRVGSALQNRPPSRNNTAFHNTARPRTAAEKAADMFGEGVLTKQPSSALKDLISKYKSESGPAPVTYDRSGYLDNLGEFLTLGVKKQFVEKTMTPRKEKPSEPGTPLKKHQMSNKVYSLSGKSWRPDSSLGENVEKNEIQKFYQEVDPKMFYDPAADPEADPALAPEEMTIRYTWSAGTSRDTTSRDTTSRDTTSRDTTNQAQSVTDSITQSLSERLKLPEPSTSKTPRNHTPSASRPTSTRYSTRQSQLVPELRDELRGSVSRSKTEGAIRSGKSRHHAVTERRCKTPMSARCSTPIVVDGDDMTRYDDLKLNTGATTPDNNDDEDDMNAMNDLELELASQTGRLTADGCLSRVLDEPPMIDVNDNMQLTDRSDTITPDTHRDIDRLRESMMDDFEEAELLIMQDEAMRVSLL